MYIDVFSFLRGYIRVPSRGLFVSGGPFDLVAALLCVAAVLPLSSRGSGLISAFCVTVMLCLLPSQGSFVSGGSFDLLAGFCPLGDLVLVSVLCVTGVVIGRRVLFDL